jgi:hypothetical protein
VYNKLKKNRFSKYLLVYNKLKFFDNKRQHNKKVESGGKLCGTDKS